VQVGTIRKLLLRKLALLPQLAQALPQNGPRITERGHLSTLFRNLNVRSHASLAPAAS
jgi:hypothetical protein